MIQLVYADSTLSSGSGNLVCAFTIEDKIKVGANANIAVTCNKGTPFLSNGNVVVPLVFNVTATSVNGSGVVTRIQEFKYNSSVAYTYTAIPSSLVVNINPFVQSLTSKCCCNTANMLIEGSITITITA